MDPYGELAGENHPVVFIVDDNPTFARGVARALRFRGYVVHCTETGGAALEMLQDVRPDVILVDQHLPDTRGDALVARIRKAMGDDAPRMVMVSGDEGDAPPDTEGRLVKPFTTAALLQAVERSVGRAA